MWGRGRPKTHLYDHTYNIFFWWIVSSFSLCFGWLVFVFTGEDDTSLHAWDTSFWPWRHPTRLHWLARQLYLCVCVFVYSCICVFVYLYGHLHLTLATSEQIALVVGKTSAAIWVQESRVWDSLCNCVCICVCNYVCNYVLKVCTLHCQRVARSAMSAAVMQRPRRRMRSWITENFQTAAWPLYPEHNVLHRCVKSMSCILSVSVV